MKDDFGDRMKHYENRKIRDSYSGHEPLYMRLDGRSFSKLTRKLKLEKPRDQRFAACFEDAILETMKEFNFVFGFHQSDEISFCFPVLAPEENSQLPFNGLTRKILSVVPSFFTSSFLRSFNKEFPEFDTNICFDARLVEFPAKFECVNMIVWRYQDARRNYITDLAATRFSHKQLMGMSTLERLEKVSDIFDINDVADFYVKKEVDYGDYSRKRIFKKKVDFNSLEFEEKMEMVYG